MRCSRCGSCCSARACSRASAGLVRAAAIGLAASAAATWFLRTVSTRVQRRFRDKVTIALESHVARLQASVATIAHHERPDYLDRLSMLRDQVFVLDHMYMSLFSTCGWILRLGVTIALLASIHPALVLLARLRAADRAHLDVASRASSARPRSARRQANRLARHLFTTATTAPPGKEVRVTGIGHRLVAQRRAAWERGYAPVAAPDGARRCGTRSHGRSSACAYVGAVVFVSIGLGAASRRRAAGAGSRLAPVRVHRRNGRRDRIPARLLDGRFADASPGSKTTRRRCTAAADRPCRQRSADGIRFEHVSFAYPGTARLVLDDVSLSLPAGCGRRHRRRERRRQDDAGQAAREDVRADVGRDPRRRRPARPHAADEWRSRLAGAFQDFFRFEFLARHTVGLGDVPRLDDELAVAAAVERAGADDVVARLHVGTRDATRADLARTASSCRSASGRSSRSRAASCAIARCCSCSTSRRPRSTPRPSTRCSNATPPPRAARTGDRWPHHDPRVAPLLDRAHGRSHRRPGRREAGGNRHSWRADGDRRAVRRALWHPGCRIPVRSLHVHRTPSGTGVNRRPFDRVNFVSSAL